MDAMDTDSTQPTTLDWDLLTCCSKIHDLLVSTSKRTLSTADRKLLQQLWNNVVQLQKVLPPPPTGIPRRGVDNYDHEYRVEAYVCSGGTSFERRFFPAMEAVGFHYSRARSNYFYYNPSGDFYAAHTAGQVGSGLGTGKIKGVKLSDSGLVRYTYPPDIPTSERGGTAERYID